MQYQLPNWLQIGQAWGIIATGFMAIFAGLGTFVLYRISGPRAKIRARADHHGRLRITIGNRGREPFQVSAVGLAREKKRRWRERGRPPRVLPLKHRGPDGAVTRCMWKRLDAPEEIPAGSARTWTFEWPEWPDRGNVYSPREFRFRDETKHKETPSKRALSLTAPWKGIGKFWQRHKVRAVGMIFGGYISCAVIKERDTAYRLRLPAAPPVAPPLADLPALAEKPLTLLECVKSWWNSK
jgi:hypothetical protein